MTDFKDPSGRIYNTPDNKPPVSGTQVSSPDGYGGKKSGTYIGGYFVENK